MDCRILFATIIVLIAAFVPSQGIDDGKYKPNQYAKKGQYVHEDNGKYEENPAKWRYVHVHDQREKGKYIHVHIPYDGGYGPYSHLDNPYIHEDNPYIHDIEPKGEYRGLMMANTNPISTQRKDRKYEENPAKWRYVHVHDQREKGKYIHVHIPYDGGYGPYSHLDNPYIHEDNPYIHDIEPKGEYSCIRTSIVRPDRRA
uniref:Uncharacterized protein n=2 Tax=Lutzomyia longipalpis TaxID=7200 RepID=A0A1B0GJ97_LUTLO